MSIANLRVFALLCIFIKSMRILQDASQSQANLPIISNYSGKSTSGATQSTQKTNKTSSVSISTWSDNDKDQQIFSVNPTSQTKSVETVTQTTEVKMDKPKNTVNPELSQGGMSVSLGDEGVIPEETQLLVTEKTNTQRDSSQKSGGTVVSLGDESISIPELEEAKSMDVSVSNSDTQMSSFGSSSINMNTNMNMESSMRTNSEPPLESLAPGYDPVNAKAGQNNQMSASGSIGGSIGQMGSNQKISLGNNLSLLGGGGGAGGGVGSFAAQSLMSGMQARPQGPRVSTRGVRKGGGIVGAAGALVVRTVGKVVNFVGGRTISTLERRADIQNIRRGRPLT